MRNPLYFFKNDILTKLKQIKRRWLYFIPFILIGIIIGIIVAVNVEEGDLDSSLANVIEGDFEPFDTFFKYSALLLGYLILVYLSQKRKVFAIPFLAFSIYVGYIIGRVATLCIVEDGLIGVLSMLIFFLPSIFMIILSAVLAFTSLEGKLNCVFSLSADKEQFKTLLIIYLCTISAIFILNVIIGSIINLIVNIV